MDEWGVCNGIAVTGPAYCSIFSWSPPGSLQTDATPGHYEIYNDFNGEIRLIHSLPDTSYVTSTPYEGWLYVVAVYSNPDGVSDTSNSIFVEGIPIGIKENRALTEISITYSSETGLLKVVTDENISSYKIINSSGIVMGTGKINHSPVNPGDLQPGIYFVEILRDHHRLAVGKIIID